MDEVPKVNDYKNGDDEEWLRQHPGRPTASITKAVECPVGWLNKLPGLRGEHKALDFNMPKIKKMADECVKDEKWRNEHPITLGVQYDGKITIDDGNHRAKAAKLAKLRTYPCVFKFYGGGEDEFNVQKFLGKHSSMNIEQLIQQAKKDLVAGKDIESITASLLQLSDDQGFSGATDVFGSPGSQDYNSQEQRGVDYGGDDDPNKGDQRRTGPRDEENDMVQEASSNKPCATCGMSTDSCVCISDKQPTMGKNPSKTTSNPGLDDRMNPMKSTAQKKLVNAIAKHGKMSREASHVEEIEIPFADLNLEKGINYHMSGLTQDVSMRVQHYLRTNVYPGNLQFTIARVEQDGDRLFVKAIVFDHQIEHEGANDTKDNGLHKVNSVDIPKLYKTAWRRRLTEVYGSQDKTGLVVCPVEGNFATRSCGACPLAENAQTYIQDGYVKCHFDDMSSYLQNGKQVHEEKPKQR